MFATIRRHQKWLLTTVVIITIISFIGWNWNRNSGNAGPRSGGPGNFGILAGHPITEEQLVQARNGFMLEYFFDRQDWPDIRSPDVDRNVTYQAYVHLFIEEKIKELGIEITPQAARQYYVRFFGPNTPVAELEKKILEPHQLNVGDLDRFLRFNVGRSQLMMLAGMHGYLVTPQEAEAEYRKEHQELASSMVFYAATNFLSSVPANAGAVAQFYTNHLADYRIPEKAQVDYVKFDVTNYLAAATAAVTNLDEMANAYERQYGTNLFRGTKTPEESRAAVKKELLRDHARVDARRDAFQFANELEAMQPVKVDNLRDLAAKKKMTVITPAPFDRENGPQDMTTPLQFVRAAFGRTPEEPFAPPVAAEDGVYVLAQRQMIPSSIPPFKTIEAKVVEDYRHEQALMLTAQAAIKLYTTWLTNALPQEKSFVKVCEEAKVKLEPLPPISRITQSLPTNIEDRVSLSMLQRVVFDTPVGRASTPQRGLDGAFILYVEKQLPVDEAKLRTELPEFTTRMRQYRMQDAFNQWLTLQGRHDPVFMELLGQKRQELEGKSVRPAKS
jgi:hypothetical protein